MADSPDVDDPTREYPSVPRDPSAEPPRADRAPPTRRARASSPRVLIFFGVVFAVMVAACLGLRAINVLPSFSNPFETAPPTAASRCCCSPCAT